MSDSKKAKNGSHVMDLPETKWIQIYVNGDEYFGGCRCVINSRYYRNLEMFLNYLTDRLRPSFGAVRNIYTPENGHSVRTLQELLPKQKYVVAGNERFKKLESGYADMGSRKLHRNTWKPKSKFKVSRAKPMCHHSLSLKLYSLSGTPIKNIDELVNSQSYVVVGKHEVFKKGPYGQNSVRNNSSYKDKYHLPYSSRKTSSLITARSSGLPSRSSAYSVGFRFSVSGTKSNERTPLQSSTALSSKGSALESIANHPYFVDSENEMSQQISFNEDYVTKVKIDLDDDFGGIFRSKAQNDLTVGAVEVEDSSETIVDLPVDLLEAEEIEDDITPDMERSLQHLSLDVPDEIVAFLPSMQKKQNGRDQPASANKYSLSHSQTLDIQNIFV
ncbi:doublecortin domain-containing protein 2-like [Uloborus diversus]|uniref:doublecortin domain-containing protein 2-like n=1 Tax=Uloborus diversus TaxID=327109 RepID=UPI002409A9E0|nr:doublecortin domain-containing protein 2-like [Uloborus diversus]